MADERANEMSARPVEGAVRAATADRATKGNVLCRLATTIESRRGSDPATSYVATLFAKGD